MGKPPVAKTMAKQVTPQASENSSHFPAEEITQKQHWLCVLLKTGGSASTAKLSMVVLGYPHPFARFSFFRPVLTPKKEKAPGLNTAHEK